MQGNKIEACKQIFSCRWTHNFLTKKMLKKYELLNMFFRRCSYKTSCFSELVYNSSVLILMVCSYKDLKDLALDLVPRYI